MLLLLLLLLLDLLPEPSLSLAPFLADGREHAYSTVGGWTARGWTAGVWTATAGHAGRHGRRVVGRIFVAAGGRVVMGHELRHWHPGVLRKKVGSRSPAIEEGWWDRRGSPAREEAWHGVGTWGGRR